MFSAVRVEIFFFLTRPTWSLSAIKRFLPATPYSLRVADIRSCVTYISATHSFYSNNQSGHSGIRIYPYFSKSIPTLYKTRHKLNGTVMFQPKSGIVYHFPVKPPVCDGSMDVVWDRPPFDRDTRSWVIRPSASDVLTNSVVCQRSIQLWRHLRCWYRTKSRKRFWCFPTAFGCFRCRCREIMDTLQCESGKECCLWVLSARRDQTTCGEYHWCWLTDYASCTVYTVVYCYESYFWFINPLILYKKQKKCSYAFPRQSGLSCCA